MKKIGLLFIGLWCAVYAAADTTRVIVSDDFEEGIRKSPTFSLFGEPTGHQLEGPSPRIRCMVPGLDPAGKSGAYLEEGQAASGNKSLRLQNAPDMNIGHLPGLLWWLHNREVVYSGTLKISFDLLVPEKNGNALSLLARDFQIYEPLSLTVEREKATLNGKSVVIARGQWSRYVVTLPVGVADGLVTLTVTHHDGGEETVTVPLGKPIEKVNMLGFLLFGEGDRHLLLDNLEILIENEAPFDREPQPATPDEKDDGWKDTPASILDVFPASTLQVPEEERGKTLHGSDYYPTDSVWHESLHESWVFHQEMRHKQDEHNSFDLRIGKGGQLYSLRGAFGESIPPQGKGNPWNDEVWQFVAVCTKYNGVQSRESLPEDMKKALEASPYQQSYFIHNSGAYIPGGSGIDTLYCPLLGADVSEDGRAYRTVNWGLVPQVKTVHRSPILYYVQTRDVGDGIIEITYVVHNFSARDDIVFDHLNAPWGGTRVSSLPFRYLSLPDGSMMDRAESRKRNIRQSTDVRNLGGWNISCVSEAPDSPSLALVFGRDRHLETELEKIARGEPYCQFAPSVYWEDPAMGMFDWVMQDWQTRPENSHRNYEVAVVIPKFRLAPGTSIWYRSFLVVNRKDRAIERAKSLVDQVDYGLRVFDPATTPRVPVYLKQGAVVKGGEGDTPAFELYAHPVPGTMPLFLVEHAETGREVITTDPYIFVPQEDPGLRLPPDHPQHDYYSQAVGYSIDRNNSRWKRLLGYGYVKKPEDGEYVQVSGLVDPKLFPETNRFHLNLWVKGAESPPQ